jgi:hypothetical protein
MGEQSIQHMNFLPKTHHSLELRTLDTTAAWCLENTLNNKLTNMNHKKCKKVTLNYKIGCFTIGELEPESRIMPWSASAGKVNFRWLNHFRVGDMAQLVECLPSKHKTLNSNPIMTTFLSFCEWPQSLILKLHINFRIGKFTNTEFTDNMVNYVCTPWWRHSKIKTRMLRFQRFSKMLTMGSFYRSPHYLF